MAGLSSLLARLQSTLSSGFDPGPRPRYRTEQSAERQRTGLAARRAQAAAVSPSPRQAPRPATPATSVGVPGSGWSQYSGQVPGAARRRVDRNLEERNAELEQERAWGERTRRWPKPDIVEIDDAAYNAMNADQKAAVDYNTALYRTRESDLAIEQSPGEELRSRYDEEVEKVFGQRGGEAYAPDTVALLSALDIEAPGANIDDYLELAGAVTIDEVDSLANETAPRDPRVDQAISATRTFLDSLTGPGAPTISLGAASSGRFSQMVGDYIAAQGLGIGERQGSADAVQSLLGGAPAVDDQSQSLADAMNADFQQLFDVTTKAGSAWTPEELRQRIIEWNWDPADYDRFVTDKLVAYTEATDKGYSTSLSSLGESMTPEEYRARLGLTTE